MNVYDRFIQDSGLLKSAPGNYAILWSILQALKAVDNRSSTYTNVVRELLEVRLQPMDGTPFFEWVKQFANSFRERYGAYV